MYTTAEILRNYMDEIEDPRKIDHAVGVGRMEAAPRVLRWGEAMAPAKRRCPQGHPMTQSNIYFHQGRRWCRKCREARDQGRRRKGGKGNVHNNFSG